MPQPHTTTITITLTTCDQGVRAETAVDSCRCLSSQAAHGLERMAVHTGQYAAQVIGQDLTLSARGHDDCGAGGPAVAHGRSAGRA